MLFDPLSLRERTARNRAWVSPMCQHSADDGRATDWHLVHLGSRAVGGAGLVMVESTAVHAEGRISPYDAGLWNERQVDSWARVATFIGEQGALSGIQLSHAGRKASTYRPWDGTGYLPPQQGGWRTCGASPLGHGSLPPPRALALAELAQVPDWFAAAAIRADQAGFDVVEVHAAHGYLLHQFLSPLSNQRGDGYGGDFAGRARLCLDVVRAVRRVWPEEKPMLVRVSATDWVEGGWSVDETVELAGRLQACGVDLVDVSSGGNVPDARIPVGPGYQASFAERIRQEAGVATAAVGLITRAEQAERIVASGTADAVMIARAHLDDPYWVRRAADRLGGPPMYVRQYDRPDLVSSGTSPGR